MLLFSKELYDLPILSLRGGGAVGIAKSPIINPHSLKIIGWWCSTKFANKQLVLLTDDVREVMSSGLAIDDHAHLSEPEDLIRLAEILNIDYQLKGKTVKSEKRRIGKVADYCYTDNFLIKKLYVEQSIVKALNVGTLIIDRSQILEVTDRYILVEEPEERLAQTVKKRSISPGKAIALDQAAITIENE